MYTIWRFLLIGLMGFIVSINAWAQTYKIYLDADRTNHYKSAYSIEMGVKTALAEAGNRLGDYHIEIVTLDHKGNAKRSKKHMTQFLNDKQALVYYGGLHSPPLIHYRKFINTNKLLTLVPWAAGAPITRYPSSDNWIFRLSVDDKKAGKFLIEHAIEEKRCQNIHLLLERTKWGEWNEKNMQKAHVENYGVNAPVTWFEWNTPISVATIDLESIHNHHVDCIVFVSNSVEGLLYMKAAIKKDYAFNFISHWGITGGSFFEKLNDQIAVSNHAISDLKLSFLQTCYSLVDNPGTLGKKVFSSVKKNFPTIKKPQDIHAPAGFIHAYDLTKILIAATSKMKMTGDVGKDRAKIKAALENMRQPVSGLLKVYDKPFSVYSADNDDAHEALDESDLCMGRYRSDGSIEIVE